MLEKTLRRFRKLFSPAPAPPRFALVLGGGGARSAYQAGVLHYIASAFPDANFQVMVGVSAGAINVAHLANHVGTFREAAARLLECWRLIDTGQVYTFEEASRLSTLWNLWRRQAQDEEGRAEWMQGKRSLVDTAPLRTYLTRQLETQDGRLQGIAENLRQGRLVAVAMITTNYATGQTVTWIQGKGIELWERPNRVSINTTLSIDHIMASTALPLLFPAVQIGDAWYGDGGIRLSSPLSPAIHLGADRLLNISTRYNRSRAEADQPATHGYPPTAQIIGILMNAIFLDALEEDALMMERLNRLLDDLPHSRRRGLRPIRLLNLRPSVDLGKLSSDYEARLPPSFQFVTHGLGSDQTSSPDWLSMLMFQEDYLVRLMDIGYADARRQHRALDAFLHEED